VKIEPSERKAVNDNEFSKIDRGESSQQGYRMECRRGHDLGDSADPTLMSAPQNSNAYGKSDPLYKSRCSFVHNLIHPMLIQKIDQNHWRREMRTLLDSAPMNDRKLSSPNVI
jgi:hypothetical protein